MDEKSLGQACFTDGHYEDIWSYSDDECLGGVRFETKSGAYVRVWYDSSYRYYRTYVNHDWETMYKRVHNIDHVELK